MPYYIHSFIHLTVLFVVYREDSQPGTMREPKRKYYISNDLRVLNIKIKSYSKLGEIHNFMLEEVKDYGTYAREYTVYNTYNLLHIVPPMYMYVYTVCTSYAYIQLFF